MEDGIRLEQAGAGRHSKRVLDQFGAVVVGHRPAQDRLAVTVDDGGQIYKAFPGRDVGDVANELGARLLGGEVTPDQVGDATKVTPHRSGGPEHTRLGRGQIQLAHQGADQFGRAVLAAAQQGGMHPPVAVGLVRAGEDLGDQRGQQGAALRGGRGRPLAPLVVARPGHLQPGAHVDDRVAGLLRIDQLELGERHRFSAAKKAAAFSRTPASPAVRRSPAPVRGPAPAPAPRPAARPRRARSGACLPSCPECWG